MANPQPDKYTRISNEILCHLCWVNLSSYETRILLYIIRKTYGYGKKEDRIALSQFVKDCRINKSSVCHTLNSLSEKTMIVRKDNDRGWIYSIQKNWEKWPLSFQTMSIGSSDNKSLSEKRTTKDNNTKETITKEIVSKDTTQSGKIKKEYGNPQINQLIGWMKSRLTLYVLDGSDKENRRYAFLLLNKFGFDESMALVEAVAGNEWWNDFV